MPAPARADGSSPPPPEDPYNLPIAPRPPTLPELTHPDLELTLESTFGVLIPNTVAGAGPAGAPPGTPPGAPPPPNTEAFVQRINVEAPVLHRRVFVGATYELAGAAPPGTNGLKVLSGNVDLNARTVWATREGLAFGGGFGVTLPVIPSGGSAEAQAVATAAATLRPWDQAFFQPGYLTLRPFLDVRDIDGPLVLQLRESLDIELDTRPGPGTHFAAVTAAYVGYRVARPLGLGIEAFEVYFLDSSVPDDHRASFAVSPNVRLMIPYVQPAVSFVTSLGDPLFANYDAWWAVRLAATVVWQPGGTVVGRGQD